MDIGFMFSTPYAWMHQHVIGHHSFPNIEGKDPDLYHAPKYIRHSQDIRHKPPHKYQTITFILTWLVGVPASLLFLGVSQAFNKPSYNRVVTFANSKYLNTNSLRPRLAFYTFVVHVIPFILHGITLRGLLFSIIPIYIFSVCFMISSQINHLTPHNHEQFNKNFFIHQVITSHDVATDNYLVFLFTGGLNMQIEHHLFPSVNHCHLHKLKDHVRDTCKKYNVNYTESITLWEALCQHVTHLRKFSFK
jgi:delta11-fatty-acid desaturase